MAEQAVNTIYTLGDQPDALCSEILRQMTSRVFGPRASTKTKGDESEAMEEDKTVEQPEGEDIEDDDEEEEENGKNSKTQEAAQAEEERSTGNAFELSQLIFVAGHCAIKQLVHLELVERDLKRRKAEDDKSKGGKKSGDDELDQVAGSVEDEIGDAIAIAREKELMYGPQSLLQVFGPMSASIVSQPKLYRVSLSLSPSPSLCLNPPYFEPLTDLSRFGE
jgi:condensin complex subunit 1